MKKLLVASLFCLFASASFAKEVTIEYDQPEVAKEAKLSIHCYCVDAFNSYICPSEHKAGKCEDNVYEFQSSGLKPADIEKTNCNGF